MALASLLLLAGTASAHGTVAPQSGPGEGTCTVTSLPSFVAQGEFQTSAMVADVIEVSCNPYAYSDGATVGLTAYQLYNRCHNNLKWLDPNDLGSPKWGYGPTFDEVHLDAAGNANIAVIGGPECMAGESLITLDEEESPYETFTTSFQVLPPAPTPEGLYILPEHQVEDANSSGVITIAEAEFKGAPEGYVRIGAKQLYNRCHEDLHIIGQEGWRTGPEYLGGIKLDNDGNGFVILKGTDSCAEGTSLIEADLEEAPFTTLTGEFTIEPPRQRF
jgi:hypothetical protein